MDQILYQYTQIEPITWVYLSSLLAIAVYFKFSRVWSVRNLDLIGLIALAPGLLMVREGGPETAQIGYLWLFATAAFFVVRLMIDPLMVRRPLLEPNLSLGGLTFLGAALLVFLMMNVITKELTDSDLDGARRLDALLSRNAEPNVQQSLAEHGPGYPLLHLFASIPSQTLVKPETHATADVQRSTVHAATARTMAILGHLAIVIGMVLIGAYHFDNVRTGIAAATLYLMLPYTALMTGRVDHVVPAALLVWAVFVYRRPLVAGILLGLAAGAIYYPMFLLPLWLGFYWHRGLLRFVVGFVGVLALLAGSLAFTSSDWASFLAQIDQMAGWTSFWGEPTAGFWGLHPTAGPYRLSVFVAFAALCCGFALWPAQKNLGTLMSCSAVVMLGTQFWHVQQGGVYMAWYLPLLLLTVFRPNLEDRVALTVLGDGWLTNRARPSTRAA